MVRKLLFSSLFQLFRKRQGKVPNTLQHSLISLFSTELRPRAQSLRQTAVSSQKGKALFGLHLYAFIFALTFYL